MIECNTHPDCASFHRKCPLLRFHQSTSRIGPQSNDEMTLDRLASMYAEAAALITDSEDSLSSQKALLASLTDIYDFTVTVAGISFLDGAAVTPLQPTASGKDHKSWTEGEKQGFIAKLADVLRFSTDTTEEPAKEATTPKDDGLSPSAEEKKPEGRTSMFEWCAPDW